VNIQPCDKHATSNRNSYVPLRPRKNGRLGAEPDTAIYLEPLGKLPGGSFSADLGSLNCLTASNVSANFLLEASFAAACSCFSVRLSLLFLSPRGSRSREAGDRPLNGARTAIKALVCAR
jgi:hypothetical protein